MLTAIVNTPCGVDTQDLAALLLFPVNFYLRLEYIDGVMQDRRNSIANASELCFSCTNPSIYPIYYCVTLLFIHALISVMVQLVGVFTLTTEKNGTTNHSFHFNYMYARIASYFQKWLNLGSCCLYFGPLTVQNCLIKDRMCACCHNLLVEQVMFIIPVLILRHV